MELTQVKMVGMKTKGTMINKCRSSREIFTLQINAMG